MKTHSLVQRLYSQQYLIGSQLQEQLDHQTNSHSVCTCYLYVLSFDPGKEEEWLSVHYINFHEKKGI